jgi:hypothetical protein
MFEVYADNKPTGLTYVGRRARRLAAQVARDLSLTGGRTHYHVRCVY